MVRLALLAALSSALGCRAILGTYEVEETVTDTSVDTAVVDTALGDTTVVDTFVPDTFMPDTFMPDTFMPDTFMPDTFVPDTFMPDTFVPDTFVPDTFVPDTSADTSVVDTGPETAPLPRSCRELYLAGTTTNGGYDSAGGLRVFCDNAMGQGFTLVAIRASNTLGDVWVGPTAAVSKVKTLDNPGENVDKVLDVDWTTLNFTEVAYELNVPLPSGGPAGGKTRIRFPTLTSTHKTNAKNALFMHLPPPERPDCFVDMGTSAVTNCFGMPPGGAEMPAGKALGWPYAPVSGKECWSSFVGKTGAMDCVTGAIGAARVWVK